MADFNSGRTWAAWASPGLKSINNPEDKDFQRRAATQGTLHQDLGVEMDPSVGMVRLTDPKYRAAFENAQAEANENAQKDNPTGKPQVDPFLHKAGLCNRACGFALEVATGGVIFPGHGSVEGMDTFAIHLGFSRTYLFWPPEKIKKLAEKADWKKALNTAKEKKAPTAIVHSARAFLEACAACDLGIRFVSR